MNYYSHHIGDYRRDTAHLSLLEHGVYRQLLDLYYLHEKAIPKETEWVFRRLSAKTEDEQIAIQTVLSDFFEERADGWYHKRCDMELREYASKADTARANGKLGGRPKKTQPVISGNPSKTNGKANHEPLTSNHKPLTSVERTARGSRLPTDWEPDFDFAVKQGIQNTLEEANKFRDYWNSQPGQKGVKTDWPATWRNWCRNGKKTPASGAQASETTYQRTMREKWEVATGRNKQTEVVHGNAELLG